MSVGVLLVLIVDIIRLRLIPLLPLLALCLLGIAVLVHVILGQPNVLVEAKLLHSFDYVVSLNGVPLLPSADLICLTGHEQQELSDTLLHGFFGFFGNLTRVLAACFCI